MKKTLLLAGAAAVLFAGAAQAEGLEMGLEGYASVYGVYVDQDTTGLSDFEIKKEMEIDVTGEVELDNGLTVGATIELQQDNNNASNDTDVQESYIYVEGGFGKVIAGKEYNAAYLMQVAAPAVDAELDGMDPTYHVLSGVDLSYDMSNQTTLTGDEPMADKLTYVSPIFEGLQVGVSYTPDATVENSQGAMSNDATEEALAFAARYATEVAGADLTIGAGWNQTDVSGNADDMDQWNVAFTAEKDAFTFGVAYHEYELGTTEVDTIAAGVNYETGAFNYGLSYLNQDDSTDDINRYMAGVNYTYGPGMTLNGSVALVDDSINNNDATIVAVGTVINF